VAGSQGLKKELTDHGFKVVNPDPYKGEIFSESAFEKAEVASDVDIVVGGYDQAFCYEGLCMAALYIQKGAKFIACNWDAVFRIGDRIMPGGGTQLAAIKVATEVEPTIVGKPHIHFFNAIREDHSLQETPLSKWLMVGDSLATDIGLGATCGIDTLLVCSGVTDEETAKATTETRPTYVFPRLYC